MSSATDETSRPVETISVPAESKASSANSFHEDLIRKYPKSNKKIPLSVSPYGLVQSEDTTDHGQSLHISPHGIEFQSPREYQEGALLKIHVTLPDYWTRKRQFVDYQRIDTPENFKILGKVVKTQDVGKRGKKKLILVQTVNMDEVDEQVLKAFLQDG